ncbi:MAG: hypothetical protein JRN61_03400 [Nitrososphaerota archaeon]|nr:hypothetical protein [Nitrososphaerota archaeon]
MKIKHYALNLLNKRKRKLDLIIYFVISIVIILKWFSRGLMITHEEMGFFFFNPQFWLYHTAYIWWNIQATGFANFQVIVYIPFQLVMTFFQYIGLSVVIREAITLFSLLSISGISMYLLVYYLSDSYNGQRIAAIAAGIIYMFNPFSLYVWTRFDLSIFTYTFLPLFLLFFIKGLNAKKNLLKYALYVNLSLILILPTLSNPYYFGSYIIVGIIVFFFFLINGNQKKQNIKFLLITFLIWMGLNSWWLLPFGFYGTTAYQTATNGINPLGTLLALSQYDYSPIYIIRLLDFYTEQQYFYSSIITIISFFLPILAFLSIVIKRTKYNLLFAFIACIGIFLSLGANPPFGAIFLYLFKHIPFMGGFRAPQDKFGSIITLAYSFLGGTTIGTASSIISKISIRKSKNFPRIKQMLKAIFPIVIIMLVILPSFLPFISGSMWNPYSVGDPVKSKSAYIQIPTYYFDASNWLKTQGTQFRVIELPISSIDSYVFDWKSGYGGIYPYSLWPQPQISGRTWFPLIDNMTYQIEPFIQYNSAEFWKVMEILNAKYVFINNDFQLDESGVMTVPSQYLYDLTHTINYTKPYDLPINNSYWQQAQTPLNVISSLENNSAVNGQTIMVTTKIQGQANWEGGIQYVFSKPLNLTGYNDIGFWINFSSLKYIQQVYFRLGDSYGGYEKWTITPLIQPNWAHVIISFNSNPTWESMKPLNLSSINYISITIQKNPGTMQATQWWLANFQVFFMSNQIANHVQESNQFGNLTFFQIQNNYFLPSIFATTNFTSSYNTEQMLNMLANTNIDPRYTVIYCKSQLTNNQVEFLQGLANKNVKDQPPTIIYQEINPTKYEINVINATGPFFLVFSTTYDKNWVAYYGNINSIDAYFQYPISNHLIANGYANSWFINRTGTYTITVYFLPQNLLYIGIFILIFTIIIISWLYLKEQHKNVIMLA